VVDGLEDDGGRLPVQPPALTPSVLGELIEDLDEQDVQPCGVGHDLDRQGQDAAQGRHHGLPRRGGDRSRRRG
jgi:hypothetical protein